MPTCIHCGETESVELLEIWEDRDVSVATCCEAFQDEVLYELQHPATATALLRRLGIEQITGHALRRCVDDGVGRLVLDWQLRLSALPQRGRSWPHITRTAALRSLGASAARCSTART